METITKEYRIPEENIEALQSRLKKLNKKAAKLNCPITTIQIGEAEWFKPCLEDVMCKNASELIGEEMSCLTVKKLVKSMDCEDCKSASTMYKIYPVKLTGVAPVLGGWRFLGVVQQMQNDNQNDVPINVIHTVPGINVDLTMFRTHDITCDHCNINRYRKETFIVHNIETGIVKQVGSSCLKDFLGHTNPHQMANWAEALSVFDTYTEGLKGGMGRASYFDLEEFLGWVCCVANKYGWVSSAMANEEGGYSTAQLTWEQWQYTYKFGKEDKLTPSMADGELAAKIMAWAQTLQDTPPDRLNDYLYNLIAIVKAEAVDFKTKGYAASLYIGYQRALERRIKEESVSKVPSEWFGKVGERPILKLKVTGVFPIESQYGTTLINKFLDTSGRIFTWFQSPNGKFTLEAGQTITIQGSIKDHNTYVPQRSDTKIKETVLTRCKLIEAH